MSGATSEQAGSEGLFPQPMTPLEFYFYSDQRPGYPGLFPIRLEWTGELDRAALEQAYRLAHDRHPLLSARVDRRAGRWPRWIAAEPNPIQWLAGGEQGVEGRIQLEEHAPVRAFVTQGPDGIATEFVFHHTAVDGLGAFQFIKDLLIAYEHVQAGREGPPKWSRVDVDRLKLRSEHRMRKRDFKPADVFRLLRVALPLLTRRAAVVSSPRSTPIEEPEPHVPEFQVHDFTAEETARLARVSANLDVMTHDLLLRDLFLTLAQWNAGTKEGRRLIRILVPTSMRQRADLRTPAANLFSYAFLTRRPRDLEDPELALNSLSEEMALIKKQRRGLYFEAGLRLTCWIPPLLTLSLKRQWPFATAVLSNLGTSFDNLPFPAHGDERRCGSLVFRSGSGAALIRPDTRVAFAAHSFAGKLSISARCDPKWFGRTQQRELLNAYVEQIRFTIESEC